MSRELVKVDKNGTKYFREQKPCWKCHGSGSISYFYHVDRGICFECNGCGFLIHEVKEYTDEYSKKLEQRRAQKALVERFNLKLEDVKKVADKVALLDALIRLEEDEKARAEKLKKEEEARIKAEEEARKAELRAISNHVCSVGDKYDGTVTYVCSYHFESPSFKGWGDPDTIYIHRFTDSCGNVLTWKSSSCGVSFEDGTSVRLRGTVKAHVDYKGEKQTQLIRCKVEKI